MILIHNHTPVGDKVPDRLYLERAAHPLFGKDGIEIVLAFLPHNDCTPYVTWNHKDGADDSGEYFHRLPEALEGFLKRIKKK